jgi:hypothetical protein
MIDIGSACQLNVSQADNCIFVVLKDEILEEVRRNLVKKLMPENKA